MVSTSPQPGQRQPGPRPAPPPRPAPQPADVPVDGVVQHPAVDAALHGIANAADLSPADQIAQYEAAHRVLQETLASIDQA